ncbi:ATP synthase F1 subunit delta [Syntrophotalea acetylenivorans]|uniref:ATP synthase subunit delta n=1 Tax=Syntrophotalea acetylenivorans TaxID=1842532 RepID=A0A1L3GQJ6_9BACT|nr:ATP synthase F1 subunit delta [Syntrophotalea acetylenivorans]APG28212.1 ATP synthase F1 subunit delta [Syntrophotalea acetylenivorans]
MSVSVISKRYARALVLLGQERNALDRFREEVNRLVRAFAVEKRLALLLESPSLPKAKKDAVLTGLVSLLQLSGEISNFLGLLQSKDRLRYLPQIEREFSHQADEALGVQRVQVHTAVPLEDSARDALSASLAERSGRQIVLEEHCDPALIGGLQVELDGQVLDGTVRTQLQRIAKTITEGE